MQYSKKIHVIGACGLAAFEKIIRFISFTFDCHPLCNFRKKQVIGEGWPDVLAKKQFEFISLHLTLRHHAIFTKKKIIEVDGLSMFTKTGLFSPHLLFD